MVHPDPFLTPSDANGPAMVYMAASPMPLSGTLVTPASGAVARSHTFASWTTRVTITPGVVPCLGAAHWHPVVLIAWLAPNVDPTTPLICAAVSRPHGFGNALARAACGVLEVSAPSVAAITPNRWMRCMAPF